MDSAETTNPGSSGGQTPFIAISPGIWTYRTESLAERLLPGNEGTAAIASEAYPAQDPE
jgi:hypothetical protein